MRKNGFTLAELLGVMVVLSLISIITVPAVTESINKHKTKLCNSQIDEIILAARSWGSDNVTLLPNNENESYDVSLKTLVDYGYIDKRVNNPVTNEEFDLDDTIVRITKKGKRYIYTMNSETIDTCYSNGVLKPKNKKSYPRVVYSRVNGGTHVGYPIDANQDMGSKYVFQGPQFDLPFNTKEECMGYFSEEECVSKNFTTPNLDYKTSPDSSWKYYLKHTLNSSGVIEEIEVCGKHNNQEFCLERSADGSKFEQNKTLLLNTCGSDNYHEGPVSYPNGTFASLAGCLGDSVYADAGAYSDGLVSVSGDVGDVCSVYGSGAAVCIVSGAPGGESSGEMPN